MNKDDIAGLVERLQSGLAITTQPLMNEAADRIEALEAALRIAAKAERDRIVAWLRSDKPDRDNGGPCRHVEHSQGTCICNELADALESQP